VGNREDLISGAKRCLLEKGYARTTARDIAAASGVSLAAIGYHFGSKDALMNLAVYETIGDWGDALGRALAADAAPNGPGSRLEATMARTIQSFGGEERELWATQIELMSLLEHNDELRTFLAGVQRDASDGLAELFLGIDPAGEPEVARTAGAVLHALIIGLLVKWSMDPAQAPSGHDVVEGLRQITERVTGDA
jgi:AcrR family transcriptional regulator